MHTYPIVNATIYSFFFLFLFFIFFMAGRITLPPAPPPRLELGWPEREGYSLPSVPTVGANCYFNVGNRVPTKMFVIIPIFYSSMLSLIFASFTK